jgi:glycosyltransferase involved in cell wall biosynthesis
VADRSLVIAVDGRELVGAPTGVGRYLRELLSVWMRQPTGDEWHVIVPALPADAARFEGAVRCELEPGEAGTWWEQTRLRAAAARLRADVLFAPGYTAPIWAPCPVVPTIHDVSYFAHPEWFPGVSGIRRRLITRLVAGRAPAVVTVSQFSAREIRDHLGVPLDRIHVAPNGAPPLDPPSDAPRGPEVLYVGSIFNRRRIPLLLDAFAEVRLEVPDARLTLVGDNRTSPRIDPVREIAARRLTGAAEWLEYVDDETLGGLYRRARVFAFLSEYEGFAMTPAEAIAAGAAPVLLDTEVAREIYGDGARLVPPSARAIAAAIVPLLRDAGAWRAAIDAGRRRLLRYSWSDSAGIVRQALAKAAGR